MTAEEPVPCVCGGPWRQCRWPDECARAAAERVEVDLRRLAESEPELS